MVWTIRIVKDSKRYAYAANELDAALSVAGILLRSGMMVEGIEGPRGEHFDGDAINEICDGDAQIGTWRRSRLRFLSQ